MKQRLVLFILALAMLSLSLAQLSYPLRRLTDHPGWDSRPAWSPDGSRLAFISRRDGNTEIYVMNVAGADR